MSAGVNNLKTSHWKHLPREKRQESKIEENLSFLKYHLSAIARLLCK